MTDTKDMFVFRWVKKFRHKISFEPWWMYLHGHGTYV